MACGRWRPAVIPTIQSRDASVPIRIKVAEGWTLDQLEHAPTKQLCEQYLGAKGGRHGTLLLEHQAPSTNGWTNHDGKTLTSTRCQLRATAVAGSSPDALAPNCMLGRVEFHRGQGGEEAEKTAKRHKPKKHAKLQNEVSNRAA
jgi:hypothetical protein